MMFKIFSNGGSAGEAVWGALESFFAHLAGVKRLLLGPGSAAVRTASGLALLLLQVAGCQSVRPLVPANLKEPGWTVRQGQAVWKLPHDTREIAGEVLAATRSNGRAFVQFSKSPFPLVVAQENANQWEVEFPPQNKHYAGRGVPPKRLIWLYLPRVLSGQPPPRNWTWHEDSSGWRLVNRTSGESLEGFFTQ